MQDYKKPSKKAHSIVGKRVKKSTSKLNLTGDPLRRQIAQHKLIEETLRKSEKKYRTLLGNLPQKIFHKDIHSVYVSCNKNYADDLNINPEEIAGKTDYDFYPKELAEKYRADDKIVMKTGVVKTIEERYVKDGEEIIVQTAKAPIKDKREKVVGILGIFWDITDKKRAERALELSEMRFRSMAENITNGLIIVEEGKVVYVNDRACKICGYHREELVSLWGPDLTAPGEMQHKDKILQETRKTGAYPEEVDTWICRKDGTQCCVNLRFSFGYSRDRRHTGYVLITDITERKRVEEAMQETMNFLDSIIESSRDPIVIGDNLGHITRVNKAFVQLVGYEQAELIGKPLGELFPPQPGVYELSAGSKIERDENFYSQTYEVMAKMIEEGSIAGVESCYFSKNRLVIPVEQTMFYVYDKKGNRIAVVVISRDITERKKAEKMLVETRNFMQDIIITSADGIVVTNALSTITLVNQAAERMLGYSKEELLGRKPRDFLPSSEWDKRDKFVECVVSGGENVCRYETRWIKKDGTIIDLGMSLGSLKDSSGKVTGLVACARDITEHKAADRRLYEYQNQLRSLASQLTLTEEQERRYIATEIHDRISQSLALAKIKLGALGAELSLKEENKNLADTRSLLEQCIHDTRSLMFDLSPPFLYEFGLRKALEWLLEDIEKQHGVRTHLEWDDETGSYDDDVRILLYQSIRELLINVVKYAQAKTAKVFLRKDDQGVHVRVEDDGKGFVIDPNGFQVSKEGGYGIFSIQERFQHLGGSLRIESRLRHGTKIALELPLAQHTA